MNRKKLLLLITLGLTAPGERDENRQLKQLKTQTIEFRLNVAAYVLAIFLSNVNRLNND